ncbi:MAG: single-stranded DNA-binding protein [Verrucomicrobiales bacterium]
MANVNKVMLIGNLTRDPEMRQTQKGAAVADFGLAVNRSFTTESGEKREDTMFIDVVVWNRQAETASQYLAKGSPVFIEGRLQLDSWEDAQSGQARQRHRVVAERVQFLGSLGKGGEDGKASAEKSRAAGDRHSESMSKTTRMAGA